MGRSLTFAQHWSPLQAVGNSQSNCRYQMSALMDPIRVRAILNAEWGLQTSLWLLGFQLVCGGTQEGLC